MIRYKDQKPLEPQNQTLSAVLVLEQLAIGKRRFEVQRKRRIREIGRDLGLNETLEMMDQARGTERDWSLTQLRVVVHENPYARIQLVRDLFSGLYDERFGLLNDHVGRVFAGGGIQSIEAEERSL
jgi:hypothetical protein